MADIAPIRSLDEAAALEWLRDQPGGPPTCQWPSLGGAGDGTDSPPTGHLKAWQKAGLVSRRGNIITVAGGSPKAGIDVAAYAAAIVLAGAAAFFPIKGMARRWRLS